MKQWATVGRYLLAWASPAVAALYLKWQLLANDGYVVVARHMGRVGHGDLTFWEKLSFFRLDLLVLLVLVPVGLLLLLRLLPGRSRPIVTGVVCFALSFLLYIQLQSYWAIGRYLSVSLVLDAVQWVQQDPASLAAYSGRAGAVKLLALLGFTLGAVYWARKRERSGAPRRLGDTRWALACAVLGTLGAVAVPWLPSMTATPYHRSALFGAMSALWDGPQYDPTPFEALGPEELAARYREFARVPAPRPDPRYWGKASDCDVVFVVFETAPARCLPHDDPLADCPNLLGLRERAFVGARHHTTYPYTRPAFFSLLTSWYPSDLPLDLTERHRGKTVPGLLHNLRERGYATSIYSPYPPTFPSDGRMYTAVGLEHVVYPEDSGHANPDDPPWRRTSTKDRQALEAMLKDMAGWVEQDRRFCAVYAPLVGHGPWPEVTPEVAGKPMWERGRAILALQDRLVGELVRFLKERGRLDRTILVVTGDHGVRTRAEDPVFEGGMIDDYSFHVPLIVHAPAALGERMTIPWITSHIDVAPTVLDLLGCDAGRESEQGTPIWDPRLNERVTFFLANHYLGADGYHDQGKFRMFSTVWGSTYAGHELHFTHGELAPEGSDTHRQARETIGYMIALQEAWGSTFMRPSAAAR